MRLGRKRVMKLFAVTRARTLFVAILLLLVNCCSASAGGKQVVDRHSWTERMDDLLHQGKHDVVLREADGLLKRNPEDVNALLFRSKAGAEEKRMLDQALADINRAIALAPSRFDLFLWRGHVYSRMDESELALKDFEVAAKARPTDAFARDMIAINLLRLNRPAEALVASDLSLRLQPKEVVLHHTRARVLRRLGRIAEAQIELDKLLKASPKDIGALVDKALYSASQKNWKEAVRANSLILQYADPRAQRGVIDVAIARRADAYMQLKDYKAALRDYSLAIKAHPYDRALRAARARAYEISGDKVNARIENEFVKELDEDYRPPK